MSASLLLRNASVSCPGSSDMECIHECQSGGIDEAS